MSFVKTSSGVLDLLQLFDRSRQQFADREAVVCGAVRLTYRQLGERVDALAASLTQLGLGDGERVAILEKNCHRHIEAYLAAARSAAVLVPINYRLAAAEQTEILVESGARAILVGPSFLPLLEAIRADLPDLDKVIVLADEAPAGAHAYERLLIGSSQAASQALTSPNGLLILYYTSGTTGRPKGVMLNAGNVVFSAETWVVATRLSSSDRYLHVLPMFHRGAAGLHTGTLLVGGCVYVADFEPQRWLRLVQEEHVTVVGLVPTMLNFVLHALAVGSYELSSVRSLIYGASPIPETLLRRVATTFDAELLQCYGMTEATPGTFLLPGDHIFDGPEASGRRLRSAGRAAPGVEVRVVDDQDINVANGEVGEVLLRARGVMLGYWKQPEASAEALRGGWMHTGDMGILDADGYLTIVDRKKDMIISGGENVYSTEVESVLCQHPAILEVAVIGVPDAIWVEAVKAIVVLKAGQHTTMEELQAFCRKRIAGYKVPRSVDFVETLPRTATGKISKRELSKAMRSRTAFATCNEA